MKILFTFVSARRISNAFFTVSGVAPLTKMVKMGRLESGPTSPFGAYQHSPSDVQKIRRVASVQSQDIHGRHSQARAVNQATDVAV